MDIDRFQLPTEPDTCSRCGVVIEDTSQEYHPPGDGPCHVQLNAMYDDYLCWSCGWQWQEEATIEIIADEIDEITERYAGTLRDMDDVAEMMHEIDALGEEGVQAWRERHGDHI